MRWTNWMKQSRIRLAIARTVIAVVSLAAIATLVLVLVENSGDQSAQTTVSSGSRNILTSEMRPSGALKAESRLDLS
jgi:hypothetical protein